MDDLTGKHPVTLAVVQMDCALGDVESNLASIAHYSRAAAEREADLVVRHHRIFRCRTAYRARRAT
jgi:hypothetical protein